MKSIRQFTEYAFDHSERVELVDWLSQGESCTLQIGETNVTIRLVDRKGRRARIAVSATQSGEAGRSAMDETRNGG